MPLDRRTAQNIIHSLGESGQPPKLGASFVNVGTEPILKRLRQDYLEGHCASFDGQDGGGACRWVEGDYGNGKTQFLRCFQEQAWELNYATAFVELSQDECPLDRADRVYGAVARAIQAKPLTPADVDRSKGIDVVFCQLLDRMFPEVLTGLPEESLKGESIEWINSTFKNTPIESTAFRTAATQHLLAKLNGDEKRARLTSDYLRGEPLRSAERHEFGVSEAIDKSNGFRMLRSLCQMLQRSGLAAGTALLFDEARQSLSLMSTRSQRVACNNLQNVIDRCNEGELPGTIFLYAVMPEFFTNFAVNYPALQQRCSASTRIKLNTLQGIPELELLRQIGGKLRQIFQVASDYAIEDDSAFSSNLSVLAGACLRDTMGTGTRRLMVKSCVQMLRDARESGLHPLTEESVERLLAGVTEELREEETAQVAGEGE